MNAQPDWDDLRVFLAVARHGSLAAAARALGVNHSTVFRRVGSLEAAVGVRLFDRLPGGYALTPAGEEMQGTAARMEEEVAAADRRLSGRDAEASGTVRVTAIDLALYVLPRHLPAFRAAYPGIRIELIVDETPYSLTRREAEVAIRATRKPPEALVGRMVAAPAFAVYASRAYAERNRPIADLAAHDWVSVDDSFAHVPIGRWVTEWIPAERIACRVNSIAGLYEVARAGHGLALLPCAMADTTAELERVGGPIPDLVVPLWLLTHADLRHTGRVCAVLDFLAETLARERDLIEGRRPFARSSAA